MTSDFTPGTRVRINIPDEFDPGHELFHGRKGIVLAQVGTTEGLVKPDLRSKNLYRIKLDDNIKAVFVQSDLQSDLQFIPTSKH
jgi:hypothetical protein